jgi:hypothetical protein
MWQGCRSLRAQLKLRLIRTPSPLGRRQTAYHSSSVKPFVAFPDVVRAGIGNGYPSISLLCTLTLCRREENKEDRCQFDKRQGPNVPSAWPVTLTHLPVSEGKARQFNAKPQLHNEVGPLWESGARAVIDKDLKIAEA